MSQPPGKVRPGIVNPLLSTLHAAGDFYGMIGRSASMRKVYERVERFARSSVPVLVLGETGCGKEMAARAIGQIAGADRPFVAVNCASIPETLLESELFGHEQGAFTGATRRHIGLLAQANGGLLFLDELGELPLPTQAKLLRAIETGEYRTVGGERTLHSHFRIVAATNRNLEDLVARNRFRLDLLHRLGAARIVIPSLRERMEDLPELAVEFLRGFRHQNGRGLPVRLSDAALDLLRANCWPGNVRELRNVIEAAAAVSTAESLEALDLCEFLPQNGASVDPGDHPLPTLDEILLRAERLAIEEALRRAGGNRRRAATLLGISEASLYRRIAPPAGGRRGRTPARESSYPSSTPMP